MNRTLYSILFIALTAAVHSPALAMNAKKKNSRCCERSLIACTAMTMSSLCLIVGLQAHLAIVRQVRDERNPCLTVWGENPEFGKFVITPPLCDAQYNVTQLFDLLDQELAKETILQSRVTVCDTHEHHQGPVKRITRTCIDKPEQITKAQIKRYKIKAD